ncbi:hypothetical protein P9D47_22240 [Bacillus haynesii]|uniref:hypothetical protein n=1 Tax=Bacillus haynesii TaxID=1925021 RepID=UPI0015945172|nr:hypothetical protein [Bacillus haynesii]NVB35644.1 hypothetical protein [Bacillus licheniformis]MCY7780966.1 hypothetical protein [Bacillus haynesii]MEC0672828.1 hypothetical protein [Bacillus haynesii]MEC1420506.1 hypothetical protein [Bacillus haynesii]MEC1470734.1 hypothetical protein [Bacillus haynesii]
MIYFEKKVNSRYPRNYLIGSFIVHPSSSFAAKPTNNNFEESLSENLSSELINKVDKFVVVENNKFILNDEGKLSLAKNEFTAVKAALKEANQILNDVDKDKIVVDGNTVTIPSKAITEQFSIAAKEGKRAIKFHWWGMQIWLTKTDVIAIQKAGIAGGAAYLGSIFSGVGGAVAGAIVSTMISEYVAGIAVKVNVNYSKLLINQYRAVTILPQ